MNIAFLSSLNPYDRNSWSGTLNYLYTSLQKKHRVIWVGKTIFSDILAFHKANFKNGEMFFPENYALLFGKLISDLLKKECYDIRSKFNHFYFLGIGIVILHCALFCPFRTINNFIRLLYSE